MAAINKAQLWDILYSEGAFERIPEAKYEAVRSTFEETCAQFTKDPGSNLAYVHRSILRTMVEKLGPMRDLSDAADDTKEEEELDLLLSRAREEREVAILPQDGQPSIGEVVERLNKLEEHWGEYLKNERAKKCPYV